MSFIIAGLGNPGEQYEGTRHNTGRIMLAAVAKAIGLDTAADFSFNKKINALTAEGSVGAGKKKEKVTLVMPETFMNHSGKAIGPLVTTAGAAKGTGGAKVNLKKAEQLIVIYDDFNLPLGSLRVSFNRSSGGHNGVESIIKAAKTEAFVRVRVGVAPANAKGVAKVPHGEKEIEKFILSAFKPAEALELKKVAKLVIEAVSLIILESREKAMSVMNGK
jgi:PTH1 family peptidyl-tRNA hydrolase